MFHMKQRRENSRRCFYSAQIARTEQRLGIAGKASDDVKSIDSTPPACSAVVFESPGPPLELPIFTSFHVPIKILLSFILK